MAIAKEIVPGMCIKHNNEIYKLNRKEVVTVGTHSHTKLKFFLKPFLKEGGEKILTLAHADSVDVIELIKKKGQIISTNGKNAQIMDLVSYETHDATIQDNVEGLESGQEATFVDLEGSIIVLGKR